MRILVTGGAGFIGSNLVRLLVARGHRVLNIDKLTYAGNQRSLAELESNSNHTLLRADICDADAMRKAFDEFQPNWVMHLAAESHVDRSIDGPGEFIQTNIVGTYVLLQAALEYWRGLPHAEEGEQEAEIGEKQTGHGDQEKVIATKLLTAESSLPPLSSSFRFLHVSTDEVYGTLGNTGFFTEMTSYNPHSPYSASKAASDHLARAWRDTYGLPVIVTNCSNNYGPFQFPEKLIPVVILKALRGEPIPVYGKGENVRDWLYVEDHAEALLVAVSNGIPGQTYNIGGNNEMANIDLVRLLCQILDEYVANGRLKGENRRGDSFAEQITFVTDRPGHDLRYAIDASKIKSELDWEPRQNNESGFRKTVEWYLENRTWWEEVLNGSYQMQRLGAG